MVCCGKNEDGRESGEERRCSDHSSCKYEVFDIVDITFGVHANCNWLAIFGFLFGNLDSFCVHNSKVFVDFRVISEFKNIRKRWSELNEKLFKCN